MIVKKGTPLLCIKDDVDGVKMLSFTKGKVYTLKRDFNTRSDVFIVEENDYGNRDGWTSQHLVPLSTNLHKILYLGENK